VQIKKWCKAGGIKAKWHKTKGVKQELGVLELYAIPDVN
jgi:hypothetical protein